MNPSEKNFSRDRFIIQVFLTLLLLMLRIFADYHYSALTLDNLALFTNRFYTRSYFH